MKKCPVCNKENEKGSYCTQCGAPLVDNQDYGHGEGVEEVKSAAMEKSNIAEKTSITKFVLILLIAVFCYSGCHDNLSNWK